MVMVLEILFSRRCFNKWFNNKKVEKLRNTTVVDFLWSTHSEKYDFLYVETFSLINFIVNSHDFDDYPNFKKYYHD